MLALAERRRRRLFPEPRNGAHQYMQTLRGAHTNTLFIAYTINHGTVDPDTPGVYNNPSTAVFTFNGTTRPEHFIEYFHFQKPTLPYIDPVLIQRVTQWMLEDFRSERGIYPDYIIVLRDQVQDHMQPTIENEEFEAFKEAISRFAALARRDAEWVPRVAFGLAPARPENSEPLVYLFQNADNIFESNEEFQHLIVSMFITVRIQNYRYAVLEPFWAAEHTASLWTKLFPTYAAFTEAQNRPLPRLDNSAQYDFDTISLQFHLDPS